MWVVSGSGVPIDSFTARDASAYNAQNRRTDVGYDAAGNQTAIGGYTWAYDAEGHLKTSTINSATATYYYDAEGRRVKRVLPVGTTVYVYDAGGNLAAEYGYAEPGARCTTCYLTADHLGSTRMLADGTGALKSLHDYLPFGEEVQAGVGGRSSTAYVSQPLAINDGTTIKFTGKEREGENGAWLDYFGARYYASVQGRFTSPDPLFVASERIADPQQWNMYAYARNNPLKLIDPTGLQNEDSQPPPRNVTCGENDTSDACMERYQQVRNTVGGKGEESISKKPEGMQPDTPRPAPASPDEGTIGPIAYVPTMPSWLVNGIAGAGDAFTTIPFTHVSITAWVRSVTPGGDSTDKKSGAYDVGEWLGTGFQVVFASAVGGTAAAVADGKNGALFGRGTASVFNTGKVRFGWYWEVNRDAIGLRIGVARGKSWYSHIPFWYPKWGRK